MDASIGDSMVRLPRFVVAFRAAGLTCSCLVVVIAAGAVAADSGSASLDDVGHVDFATSGSPAAQARFLRGLAQLHNFEYESAAEEFVAAQAIEPGFAMAYWGEAMTKNHPIWMEQDAAAGRAVLMKLGANAEARLA
ncbi:MAG TPA: hypothetical protein VE258_14595, partial [Ktedonobacterales bacterium]|nr:hypothetical protein [Ktedonobacterales bacterium]